MNHELTFENRYNSEKKIQYYNDEPSAFHCHHYIGLVTKMALELEEIDGISKLYEAMEESFYLIFRKYFVSHNISEVNNRISIVESYYQQTGMGKLRMDITEEGGTAEMTRSHTDEGWIKKWGQASFPVNYIGQGYIAGGVEAAFDKRLRVYKVDEIQSIVMGNSISKFVIKKRGDNNEYR
jgi:predicted hydrocarbon binding protein